MSKNEKISEILKFKIINKLKSVSRMNSVDIRKESSAEHSWSCLILADYFLNKLSQDASKLKIDRLKVYELLMYHDLAEIYAGDFPLSPALEHVKRKKMQPLAELSAAKQLKKELPKHLADKYYLLFKEFKESKTSEAKFAKTIDILDAQIQEIDYKEDWKGWTKDFLLNNKRSKCFNKFPEIKKYFLELLDYYEEEGYFRQ
jgi:putative hydrolases of HD superfamily